MGVTVTIALVFWLASSFIEYKIIKSFPRVKKFFDHPAGGIVISIAIGLGVGAAIGSASGLGVFIGQIIGLATNQFTYKLYSAIAQINVAFKESLTQFKAVWVQNKEAFVTVVQSFKTMFRAIASIFMGILWVLSIPTRIANFLSRGKATA